ncbi:MAG TPA: FAD-dependent oxidoreductase [Stackebrandtia sp.]|jgi:D-amino-acid oxidase|uniref:FAD-dependent oxidoreductase n=1 Tax=Stackebrandtia sp. TaxID=2023065 RepID=UPI002D265D82|nr:FAD-dependent oxidoreductase [Stackebrandtia sp.]HZE39885.1 FAD-dependent oxidoreductase [Stackebrandtia sp.]
MGDHQGSDALVIGAGVSGLTTAVVLAEAGFDVRVMTSLSPHRTVSAKAGASWGPFMSGHSEIERWSAASRTTFVRLAGEDGSGVHLNGGIEAYENMAQIPGWARAVPGFRLCRPEEIPRGYTGAWRYTIPLIDMPTYLDYLASRLTACGGSLEEISPLTSLATPLRAASIVVNCTGLGARELVGDEKVVPCRGQLAIVDNPGITEFFQDNVDDDEITCIFPHGDTVVLGGISQSEVDDEEYDLVQERRFLDRCAMIDPRLASARVRERRVGLRPQRETIRVERDRREPRLIHNYGHGGSGVTLSWGCAMDVLTLAQQSRG